MDPLFPFSAVPSVINASIKIFEATYQLKDVDEQFAHLLATTNHVNLNVKEARRLLRVKNDQLDPNERSWMDEIIGDTEDALRKVAELLEAGRINKATTKRQSINFKNRVMWVYRDNPRMRDRHARLMLYHQSLLGVFSALHMKGSGRPPSAEETVVSRDMPPPYDTQMEEFLNWKNPKRLSRSCTDVSSDSILTSPALASSVSTSSLVDSTLTPDSNLSPSFSMNKSSHILSGHSAPYPCAPCSAPPIGESQLSGSYFASWNDHWRSDSLSGRLQMPFDSVYELDNAVAASKESRNSQCMPEQNKRLAADSEETGWKLDGTSEVAGTVSQVGNS